MKTTADYLVALRQELLEQIDPTNCMLAELAELDGREGAPSRPTALAIEPRSRIMRCEWDLRTCKNVTSCEPQRHQ
jgi:hypothetical protein